ncbi:bifunctional isocitrate dehydrogenase kinase/phosphatase [Aeromonas molluscorum]|jgi:isocitrate dehydrogenase kinase/phosphatase|uniref:Isocitrate dehydrogenase kinase/phosphatase n=1 Tax=Aeromonas molluscorum 848 TaxID=1268236 RepID=R1F458_9GAMM|nr:bifunctional isocitrate dehydrogenase kinase/phosphatase [Aeromonas molluscorum]EOD54698.1 bifunctional isocitrate dehydrogenase kinase/phosphatase protein [Aeromonas molluscorum 848]
MDKALGQAVAETILQRFESFYSRFLEITQGSKSRFEHGDWLGVQLAGRERIRLYDHHVGATTALIRTMMGEQVATQDLLKRVKSAFSDLLPGCANFEVAESFFNSVYRRIFRHRNIRDENLYIHPFRSRGEHPDLSAQLRIYPSSQADLPQTLRQLFADYPFTLPYEDKERDIAHICRHLTESGPAALRASPFTLELLREVFYRNKGAYLVGLARSQERVYPFILPLLSTGQSIYVDTLIFEPELASIVFGFARAYFMVYAPEPALIVAFLRQILPHKPDYELYNAIGCQKHGKTEFYRHYRHHMAMSRDQLVIAPGIKGMVMSVFTLPSYDVVFKVIKDEFTPPKDVSHEQVKAKYRLVKQHDRVGRMADTQEFTNFEFPLERISPELLDELQRVAPSALTLTSDKLVIKHLYTERKMIPLNLYLDNADEQQTRLALEEYGNAIKQLAAANIFPGDMLFKNFGVTRHGRVVFYDYDEICYMTECNFRQIPPPRYPEDELSAEPWYSVAPNDIFPEEFATFLLQKRQVREIMMQVHSELFDASYWQGLQANIQGGSFEDVYPYRRKKRFRYQQGERGHDAKQLSPDGTSAP